MYWLFPCDIRNFTCPIYFQNQGHMTFIVYFWVPVILCVFYIHDQEHMICSARFLQASKILCVLHAFMIKDTQHVLHIFIRHNSHLQ